MEGDRKVIWEAEAQEQLHPSEEQSSSLEDRHQDFHVFQRLHMRYRPKVPQSVWEQELFVKERFSDRSQPLCQG